MSKLEAVLSNGKALIPYFTFGDPSPKASEDLVLSAFECGADVIELGIPFSDPIADGPVIQASHQRALNSGEDCSLVAAFDFLKRLRKKNTKPVVFMLASNLVYRYGISQFFKDAARVNLSGAIIPDLSIEDAGPYISAAKKNEIPLIFLISPITNDERLTKIVKASQGFVYMIAATGTTGARQSLDAALPDIAKRIQNVRKIPVAVGFGISRKEHVQGVWKFASAAIVGSYFVNIVGENRRSPKKAIKEICDCIQAWKS